MNKFTRFLYALLIVIAFTIGVAYGQVKVIHFNAGWNEDNNVEWFNKLSDVNKKTLSIDDKEIQEKYEIFIVPTIIVFDEGEEVKRFQADLSFEMVAKREEVQEYIDELIISKF